MAKSRAWTKGEYQIIARIFSGAAKNSSFLRYRHHLKWRKFGGDTTVNIVVAMKAQELYQWKVLVLSV